MNINPTGIILAIFSFFTVVLILFTYDRKASRVNVSELDKRLSKVDQNSKEREETNDKKIMYQNMTPLEKLQYNLDEAEITMGLITFIAIFIVISVVLYLLALSIFKQPLVSVSPLAFSLYFLPKMVLDMKRKSIMKRFNEELSLVLRRMSSILQTGSTLQALEEVVQITTLSKKMKEMLGEVHHRFRYGSDIIDAFYEASKDINSENLKIAIVSLDVNKELGADLATSLNDIAKRIQDKDLANKEAESLMASTAAIGMILSIAPFAIIGYLGYSNPTYFSAYLVNFSSQAIFLCLMLFMFFGIFIVNTQTKSE